MLAQRIVTAICLLAIFAGSLFAHWAVFAFLVVLVLLLSAWEWSQLADLQPTFSRVAYVVTLISAALLLVFFYLRLNFTVLYIAVAVVGGWFSLLPLLIRYPLSAPVFSSKPFTVALGALVLVSTALGLLWLHTQESGAWWVLLLICTVAVADSGAYFSGRAFGKTPLAPKISPSKTFEGVYGGLIANLVAAVLLCFILGFSIGDSVALVVMMTTTSLLSVEGDLLESVVKRSRGVKDSGQILPGHGGILDRVDGLCAATPIFILGFLLAGF